MAIRIDKGTVSSTASLPYVAIKVDDANVKEEIGDFISWDVGSLAAHIYNSTYAYINGKIPSATTTDYYAAGGFLPNPQRFTENLNLSAFSTEGVNMLLISPWHVIGSHVSATGAISFVDSLGNTLNRTVTAISPFSQNTLDANKNFVGLLDSPINSISPIKFLPADYTSYLKGCTTIAGNPLVFIRKKQFGGTKVQTLQGFLTIDDSGFSATLRDNMAEPFINWTSAIVGGDSNGAVFCVINDEPVLITSLNNTSGGRNYANHLADIQGLIDGLRSGETLSTVDLSTFRTY